MTTTDDTDALDVDAIANRSMARIVDRLPADAPCRRDGTVICPFCDRDLTVRRTILGTLDAEPDTGVRPHVDGVQCKCAGEGCGFRPDFDVPLVSGRGFWPRLTHTEEFERELACRNGERVVDMGFTPGSGDSIQERLQALGYLPAP